MTRTQVSLVALAAPFAGCGGGGWVYALAAAGGCHIHTEIESTGHRIQHST